MRAHATIALSLLLPICAAVANGADAPAKSKATAPAKATAPPKVKAKAEKAGPSAQRELATPAVDVEFDAVALGDALDVLRGLCKANVFVDPQGLEAAGVKLDAPVTVAKDKKATVKSVLAKVLAEAGKADRKARLTFVTTGNIVLVSTAGRAKALSATLREDARRGLSDADRALLGRVLPEVTFDGMQLADVLGFVAEVSAMPVEPDWEQLEAAGVKRDNLVDLHLHDVTVAELLRLVLEGTGPTKPVSFATVKGRTRVSSLEALVEAVEAEFEKLDAAPR